MLALQELCFSPPTCRLTSGFGPVSDCLLLDVTVREQTLTEFGLKVVMLFVQDR